MCSFPGHQGCEQTNAGLIGKDCDKVTWNRESQKYLHCGTLNGKRVQILIETGCTNTMVSANYIHPECLDNDNKKEKILCVNGDIYGELPNSRGEAPAGVLVTSCKGSSYSWYTTTCSTMYRHL